jgi:glycosyltransferase involved in cell wall biosynthesis
VGGAESVAFRQAQALALRGHEVTVLAGALPSEGATAGQLGFDRYRGLPVYRLVLRSLDPDHNFHWPAAARRLRALIAANDIEIVLLHNAMGLGADLILACKAAGARCVVTLHDHWGFCFRATRLRPEGVVCSDHEGCAVCQPTIEAVAGVTLPMRLRRDYVAWCLSHAERLIVPSTYLARAYQEAGFSPERLTVISNGIDLDVVTDTPKRPSAGRVRFLCSAWLGEHKGIPVLMAAAELLAADRKLAGRWHLTIVGDGHLRGTVATWIQQSGLPEQVSLRDRMPRADVLALLPETDVAVLPSIWPENEPVSLLEAIASGTAQIATRVGGSESLVDDELGGYLVAPGDAAALAEAMRRYVVNPNLAITHGIHNRRKRGDFDEAVTISRLEAIFAADLTAPSKTASAPVVICGAGSPPGEAHALARSLHAHLLPGTPPRLIWHSWADAAAWNDAALLWFWDRRVDEALFNQALSHGVPILAPSTDWGEGVARHYGGVVLYRTYLEAMAALRALLGVPGLRGEFSRRAWAAAAAAASLAPRAAFDLRAESAA